MGGEAQARRVLGEQAAFGAHSSTRWPSCDSALVLSTYSAVSALVIAAFVYSIKFISLGPARKLYALSVVYSKYHEQQIQPQNV